MRIFTILGILFYTVILSLVGGLIIGFSLNLIHIQDIISILEYGLSSYNLRIFIGIVGLLLILVSISFAQLILGRMQRERTIAFTNPSGQVTVSLSAIEDLIRRIGIALFEIKELRPSVIAGKKGIEINLRVILRSETDIPEFTCRLQNLVRSKIQEILGIEEDIVVRVHIAKISIREEKKKKEHEEPAVPFHGYRKTQT